MTTAFGEYFELKLDGEHFPVIHKKTNASKKKKTRKNLKLIIYAFQENKQQIILKSKEFSTISIKLK